MPRILLTLLLLTLAAGTLVACGDDDEEATAGASQTEEAYLKGMVPHHESAVEMAEIASDRGEHRQVKELAGAIIETQNAEIEQMEDIYQRLTGEEIVPDPAAHEELGLSQEEAGMDEGGAAMLEETTKDFDKAFIDMMIPHHQGAIRMAHVALGDMEDEELTSLARAIIDAQSREIREMNSWRESWYGSTSPAGGVPSEDELPPSGDDGGESNMDMEH